jgi:uncharacterized protein with HEPN domain
VQYRTYSSPLHKRNGSHNEANHLKYIIKSCKLLESFAQEPKAKHKLENHWLTQDGVIQRLHTIMESAQYISLTHQQEQPQIAWQRLRDLRNALVHDYLGTMDTDVLWNVCKNEIADLRYACEAILDTHYKHQTQTGKGYGR